MSSTCDGDVDPIDADGNTRYIAIMTNLLARSSAMRMASASMPALASVSPGASIKHRRRQAIDESFKDGGVAWQLIAGVRYALNPNVDLGLKYRYFHPSRITEQSRRTTFRSKAGCIRIRCWRR